MPLPSEVPDLWLSCSLSLVFFGKNWKYSDAFRKIEQWFITILGWFYTFFVDYWITMKIFSDVEQEQDLQEMEILDDLTFEFI